MNDQQVESLLTELTEEFAQNIEELDDVVTRDITFSKPVSSMMAIIGMRRTGKTVFLLQYIQQLLADGIQLEQILYLNFEDDRLWPTDQAKLRQLVNAFYRLNPDNHDRTCYLLFDEIQNVEDWPRLIRRLADTKKVRIIVTGSSAKILSKEIATELRGRSLAIEMWPFSFAEYLKAMELPPPSQPFGRISQDKYLNTLKIYLNQGGFPGVLEADELKRHHTLQDYVNVVLFRDIVERHRISNIYVIRYMINTLIKNISNPFSVQKLYRDLKSQGIAISRTTIYDYLDYLEDAYLILTVPLYHESIRKTQTQPKKVYAIDTGLVTSYTTSTSDRVGQLFENLVFLTLKRQGCKVYYYLTKNHYEVDFLAQDPFNQFKLYQVVWNADDEKTYERESRALKEASEELGIAGEMITPKRFLEWHMT